jgi:hypothetical protein
MGTVITDLTALMVVQEMALDLAILPALGTTAEMVVLIVAIIQVLHAQTVTVQDVVLDLQEQMGADLVLTAEDLAINLVA